MRRVRRERTQVDVLRRRDLHYWTGRLGVTVEELRTAVSRVGTRLDDVAAFLGKPL